MKEMSVRHCSLRTVTAEYRPDTAISHGIKLIRQKISSLSYVAEFQALSLEKTAIVIAVALAAQ